MKNTDKKFKLIHYWFDHNMSLLVYHSNDIIKFRIFCDKKQYTLKNDYQFRLPLSNVRYNNLYITIGAKLFNSLKKQINNYLKCS